MRGPSPTRSATPRAGRTASRRIRSGRPATGHYYGIDISPDILIAAKQTLTAQGLQAKVPHLTLTKDLTPDVLPDAYFDV
ncbi:hypothetical protein ACPXCX_54430, partial [Streptomyces sp. DT225]